MVPLPEYLKQYALEKKQKGNRCSFKVKCTCGCETFTVLKKNYTNDEKQLIKEYEASIPNTGWHTIHGGIDSNGNPYSYIRILGIFRKYVKFPAPPIFMEIDVIKAKCALCQNEIVLFDSRYHGYNGMTFNDEEVKKYIPHFKQRGNKLYHIEITIENEPSLEAFNEVIGEQCSLDFYSNSFSWIGIYGLDENGKKKLLYDFETA